jgi:putative endonuclease
MKKKHYVYIVECKYGTYYTGYTGNVEDRVKKHNEGKGAKYLRGRGPVKLVWVETYKDKVSALRKERTIKRLNKEQKQGLVNGGLEDKG